MYFKINFGKNTIFFSLFIVLFIVFSSLKSFENNIGSPYIQKVVLNNYGFSNNNFSIIQDFNDIIYIGNTNGIIQYDGSNWEIVKVPGIPRMDINSKGIIYVGGNNDFGYISNQPSKAPTFISLKDSVKSESLSFNQINQVYSILDEIYFCNGKEVFRCKENKIEKIDTGNKLQLFKVNEQIYLEKYDVGLFHLVGNEFQLLPGSKNFNKKDIVDILPYNEQLLVKTTKEKGFYLFDNFSVSHFSSEADNFLYKSIFTSAEELSDGNYAIGTALDGIIVINKQGKVISIINENSGLFNSSINELFSDHQGNLWALHDQGISRIEIPSPYSYFNKNHGLRGNVKSVIRFNNMLYVATTLGVYRLEDNSANNGCLHCSNFVKIKEIKSLCYEFHQFKDQLFVSSVKGVYEIKDDKAKLFYNREADEIVSVLRSKKHSSFIYLGYNNGFSAVRIINGILIIDKKHPEVKGKIVSIAEENDGTIWLSSEENGLYQIDASDNYSTSSKVSYFADETIFEKKPDWINLFATTEGILYSTSLGIYRFNKSNQIFYKDTLIGIDFINQTNWVFPIAEDYQNNLWLNIIGRNNSQNKTMVKNFQKDSLKVLRPLPLNRLEDFLITSIHPDKNNIVWFGGFEGLIRLDLKQEVEFNKPFSTIFHKITIGKDSLLYQLPFGQQKIDEDQKTSINYNNNSIKFEFSAPNYESEDQIAFQFKLEGFEEDWSDWTSTNFKEYTNLFEGAYNFKLRAKNIFETYSDEINYSFSISPPFFRTKLAFILYIISAILLFILIGKWREYYFARERFKLENIIHERTEEVVIQKEKADNLLERVLPKNTAKELKSGRKAGPYHYNMVTVLFSDIQGFTKISEQMDSELLIDELDRFFLQFDTVVEKYNIEKIKTIGDAYMCAGGIPAKNRTNPVEVVLAAIEMQNFMKELKRTSDKSQVHIWDLRIGIDTGPVVAGVLGRSKISYDIWGGTVNTASRMEASGEPGKINITENTYMLIKDFFICQYRGKMPVKYKGEIDMYFVEGFMPNLSSDLKGQIPNNEFFTHLQILRINDVEEFVLSKLEEGLPDNLYYHNVKHTIDVVTQVELIGRSEGINDEEMLMLKTAALFHDMGHLINYDTHEEESIKLAKKILPEYHYTEPQIETICNIIQATQMPPQPKSLLEQIMCDADLDYLGRTDFVPVSINLYKEYHERKKIDSILDWNQMQYNFIKNHQYFTKTAQKLREVNKKKQLENIQNEIKKEVEMDDE